MALTSRAAWNSSRVACTFSITLVFLMGAITGGVITKLSSRSLAASNRTPNEAEKIITLEKWKKDLNLTPEQTQDIELVLDDFTMYYRNVVSDGKNRIMKILNEEQKVKFQKILGDAAHQH